MNINPSWCRVLFLLALVSNLVPIQAASLPRAFLGDTAGNTWLVEIAATPQSRARGLMRRPYLPPWAGMLFIFPRAQESVFWMKNTLIALDIRFYDDHGNPLARYPYVPPCREKNCPTYASGGKARYVLELRAATLFPTPPAQLSQLLPLP